MRTALSILLAALAGLLAVLALVGARAEALVYTPGPLQRIAGPMAADEQLRQAVPEELGTLVREQLPEELPAFLQSGAGRLVQGAADGLVDDDRFPAAWATSLEQTRTDWVDRIDRLAREQPAPGVEGAAGAVAADAGAATVHLQTAPLVDLGLDRLSETLEPWPGGGSVADAARQAVDEAVAGSGGTLLAVDLAFPDPQTVPVDTVVLVADNLHRWPWLAGASAVLALLALLVAPLRRKGVPLLAAGLVVLAAGAAGRWRLQLMGPPQDASGIARAASASLLEGIRTYALPDTILLMAAGAVLVVLGIVVSLVAAASGARSRPDGGRGAGH
jgi:hypothetical protein